MNFANLIGGVIFSGIGLAAFVYGKKRANAKPMLIGIALAGYSYLISDTVLIYAIGVLLTAALFFFRD